MLNQLRDRLGTFLMWLGGMVMTADSLSLLMAELSTIPNPTRPGDI